MGFTPIIGLEIHIELSTKSKMFCSCLAEHFGHKPNIHVCPVCLGLPGALPVANKKAIEWTVLAGMALGCKIPLFSKFDRKNYFYPDLPKGYQISQYDLPFCRDGRMKLRTKGKELTINILRVHLEEDTAKMIHTGVNGEKTTLIDFNRSGVPLMEIVTEPDIRSASEAKEFLKKLQQIIRYLEVSDCDMEKGSMRLEANVSLKKKTAAKLPSYKVEIKNLNSFRFVERALEYEIRRQLQLIKSGQKPIQETRGWNEVKQVTVSQREKEEAADYRYFPEPDLPPIRWSQKELKKLKSGLPELPNEKIKHFIKQFNLSKYQAEILTNTRQKAEYYEAAANIGNKHKISTRELANVIINKKIDLSKIMPAELVQILLKKKLTPSLSVRKLTQLALKAIEANPQAVADYRAGKEAVVDFLIGQIARLAKTKIDPNQARKILLEKMKQERFN